jgi:SAM-dependent methyltransferase
MKLVSPHEAFEAIAWRYDLRWRGRISVLLRALSLATLLRFFKRGDAVIELGCGTGFEAVSLAKRGIRVCAVDPSPRMLALTLARARRAGVEGLVHAHRLTAAEVGSLRLEDSDRLYDGAYSSFGPISLEEKLHVVPGQLAVLLRPGAHLITSTFNYFCLVEFAIELMALKPRKAIRRIKRPTLLEADGLACRAYAYRLGELKRLFAPHFRLMEAFYAPVLVPPYEYEPTFEKLPSFVRGLAWRLDRRLWRAKPFNALGSHLFCVFVRC